MGEKSRGKRERIKLTEAQFYRLQSMMARRQLLANELNAKIAALNMEIVEYAKKCGLDIVDAETNYTLDEKTLSAIPSR